MKRNVIRLTESDLHRIVRSSVNKIIRESVLSNNFHEVPEDDSVYNNYEPFGSDFDEQEHELWSSGEEEYDPTEYDPDAYIDKNLPGDYYPSGNGW